MKKFVLHAACFAAIQVALLAVVLIRTPLPKDAYFRAVKTKQERLRTTPSPRIVFVGGSSWAFGLDSDIVERKLGLHPVNMGLFATLGLDYMLAEAEEGLRPGDVVVLGFEYPILQGRKENGNALIDVLRGNGFSAPLRKPVVLAAMLDSGLTRVGELERQAIHPEGKPAEPGRYLASAFNAHGDFVGHMSDPSEELGWMPDGIGSFIDASLSGFNRQLTSLNAFCRRCEARAIRIFYAHPPIPAPYFDRWKETVLKIGQEIDKIPVTVIRRAEDASRPTDNFLDTNFHLIWPVAQKETELLVERLKPLLATAK